MDALPDINIKTLKGRDEESQHRQVSSNAKLFGNLFNLLFWHRQFTDGLRNNWQQLIYSYSAISYRQYYSTEPMRDNIATDMNMSIAEVVFVLTDDMSS